jgi:hypothetical protein
VVSDVTLEERVIKLEKLVEELMHKTDLSVREKDWRRTVGMFKGDAIMKEIIEEGRRIREEDRRRTGV